MLMGAAMSEPIGVGVLEVGVTISILTVMCTIVREINNTYITNETNNITNGRGGRNGAASPRRFYTTFIIRA